MLVVEEITGVGLQPAGVQRPIHIAGHAVEEQIAHRVRSEMHAAVAAKAGGLKIQIARGFLVGHHAVIILLVLIFIQIGGIEGRGRVGHGARRRSDRSAPACWEPENRCRMRCP